MNLKRYFYSISLLFVLIGLIGCSSQPITPPDTFDETRDSSYYLQQAKDSEEVYRIDWLLFSVQALIKENRLSAASKLLTSIPNNLLSFRQNNDKILSIGEILVKTNKRFNLNYLDVKKLDMDQRVRYYAIKLLIDKQNGDINEQIHDYISMEKYADKSKKNKIVNNTWLFLNALTQDQIQLISINTDDVILKGWLDLLNIYAKNNQSYIPNVTDTKQTIAEREQAKKDQLKQGVYNWAAYYSNHPALILTSKLMGEKPFEVKDKNARKVALLLPLNGGSRVFGETIRQGYLNAMNFYPNEPEQNVIVLDTTSNSISSLVNLAEEQGAKLIVGPLLKDHVQEIKRLAPTIPVLALNKLDDDVNLVPNNGNICFFALSPEDVASDAANHIYEQQKMKPLLLVPRTDLGKRVAQSFAEQWQKTSGIPDQVYVQYFDDISKLRANMNKNVGIDLKGEPITLGSSLSLFSSKSQLAADQATDFDAIYIYASYSELNLIKPMIEMNTNEPLSSASMPTVYTSSQSHTVNASTDFYFDMEGIQFADIPMIMNPSSIASKAPINVRNNYSLARLYAMGIDAWRLANRFDLLTSGRINQFDGMTGKLSTAEGCEINRTLIWKQYRRGKIQPISTRR